VRDAGLHNSESSAGCRGRFRGAGSTLLIIFKLNKEIILGIFIFSHKSWKK
jgi:hypothetical protein